jgi:signal peptidase II
MDGKRIKSAFLAVVSSALLVLIDQVTKWLAISYLSPKNDGSDIILWNGVFRLSYLENRGAAFGIMAGKSIFLIITTIIVFIAIVWFYLRIPAEKKFRYIKWLVVFIIAGAIGNFVDRIRFNFVVDFFYFELIDFPIFNMADTYVVCGVILLILFYLFYYKEEDLEWMWPSRKKEEA